MLEHRSLKQDRIALSAAAASLLAAVLLLVGCSAFFDFNLLKGLDKPSAPTASDYQGSGGLDKLAKDLSSPAIVSALAGDPAATAGIDAYLKSLYGTPQEQQAAALDADLNLKTTSGDVLVNNAVTFAVSGGASGKTVQQILQEIVPANVASDSTAFTAMVNGLLAAEAAYQVLGATVPPAPADVNMGDAAQKAVVAYTMDSLITFIGGGTAAATTQMFNLMNNPSAYTGPTGNMPDPFSGLPGNPAWLGNIITAAGAPMPS